MCGIVGSIEQGVSADECGALRGVKTILHRGPDDQGVWQTCLPDGTRIGLGSTRLAILDLSPAGHMPMATPDGNLTIVYNGEIYNYPELKLQLEARGYHFRSHSDTEAVLYLYQEYGAQCVHHLNGMFAIAIWDKPNQSLFLARDHFGVKPLYYVQKGSNFAFASEIKALLEMSWLQPEVDLNALSSYLTLTWVPDPKTVLRDVFKLQAGNYAIFKNGELKISEYWDLTFPRADVQFSLSEDDLAEQVRERFAWSVKRQMLSDVPIGAFLSAGMDSTSIVAMMAAASNQPVQTYTITFPAKYRVGEQTLDDPAVARQVAAHFGCNHHEIVVEPHVADLLPRLLWHMDEPTADPAIIMAYLVCEKARETVTVLLSGVGGDELFAGYRKHYAYYWSEAYKKIPAALRGVLEPISLRFPSMRGTPLKGIVRLLKKMARSGSLPPHEAFLMNSVYWTEVQKKSLLSPAMREASAGNDPFTRHREYFRSVEGADFLNQMLYLDTKAFMVSLNLTYNDKMSMASSLETRVPFLDREFAEFVAWNVPPHLKMKDFFKPKTKYILRRAMRDILPKQVLQQPKAGFGAPLDYWLTNDLREMADDLLSENRVRERGYFDPSVIKAMRREHRNGMQDWSMQIWQLLTLELWMQTFLDKSRPVQSLVSSIT